MDALLLVTLLLVVFVGLLFWGRAEIARNLGGEVATGMVVLVLATVTGVAGVLLLLGSYA